MEYQPVVKEMLELAVQEANKQDIHNYQRFTEKVASNYNELGSSPISASQAASRIDEWGLKTTVKKRPRKRRPRSEACDIIYQLLEQCNKNKKLDKIIAEIGDVVCTLSRKEKETGEMSEVQKLPESNDKLLSSTSWWVG
jgi:hypothetical protein